jgi:pyrrolidone-carboxylate peptidase
VEIRTRVLEYKPATRTVQEFPNGPTTEAGWVAVEGGGGGYLSNESAYRATRLVNEAGVAQPAGHLHTPVLTFDPANTTEISDATLVANRTAIAAEAERLLGAGVTAIG